ncbi:transposase [Nonomuraea wenchangensis]
MRTCADCWPASIARTAGTWPNTPKWQVPRSCNGCCAPPAYATPAWRALLDRRLYLPARTCPPDPGRCRAAGIRHPGRGRFCHHARAGHRMVPAALEAGVPARWVTGDEVYGQDPRLRSTLEEHRMEYVPAIAGNRRMRAGHARPGHARPGPAGGHRRRPAVRHPRPRPRPADTPRDPAVAGRAHLDHDPHDHGHPALARLAPPPSGNRPALPLPAQIPTMIAMCHWSTRRVFGRVPVVRGLRPVTW